MVLASLKQYTEHLHQRVEAAVDIPNRTQNLETYSELLARLLGFHEPFERRLAQVSALESLELDLPARRKTPLVAADLAHLGYTAEAIGLLPRCGLLPEPQTAADALGCLYVVEGATLGGQVIRRLIKQSLGMSGGGAAFFSSYGADIGRMWKAFCVVVETTVTSPHDVRRAQAFAAETFEAFETWVAPREAVPQALHRESEV